jgi:sugar lactone lactonase YvrE
VQEFEARAISPQHYELGECCRWDEARNELSWVDVLKGRFFRAVANPELSIVSSYQVEGFLSAVAPYRLRSDGWIIATNQSISRLFESGDVEELARPEARNSPSVRMNDGLCDPWGRFLVGSMALDVALGRGSFYRFEVGREPELLFSNVTVSNGVGFSPDARTMYYVDSGPGTVHAIAVDANGALGERNLFLYFDPREVLTPDGLCVDEDGCLWVAFWDGGEVRQFAPSGEQLSRVVLPVSRPTSCAIGGESGTTLFITTARDGLNERQISKEPDAGRVFSVDVGVRGLKLNAFGPGSGPRD